MYIYIYIRLTLTLNPTESAIRCIPTSLFLTSSFVYILIGSARLRGRLQVDARQDITVRTA